MSGWRSRVSLAILGALAISVGSSFAVAASTTPATNSTLWGWATVRNASSSYALGVADHRTSAGTSANVQHLATGVYAVTFKGIGNDHGDAQASAFGNTRDVCELIGFSRAPKPANERVEVACYTPSGANADSPFTLTYLSASHDTGPMAYLWATGLGSETANAQYRFASNGGAITINRPSTGFYQVTITGLATGGGNTEVTAQFMNGQKGVVCQSSGSISSNGNELADVSCYDRAGSPIDNPFFLVFMKDEGMEGHGVGHVAYLWAQHPSTTTYHPQPARRYSSSGLTPIVNRTGTGRYVVTLNGMPVGGTAIVTTFDQHQAVCHAVSVHTSGSPQQVKVRCDARSGNPFDTQYELLYEK